LWLRKRLPSSDQIGQRHVRRNQREKFLKITRQMSRPSSGLHLLFNRLDEYVKICHAIPFLVECISTQATAFGRRASIIKKRDLSGYEQSARIVQKPSLDSVAVRSRVK
jgi:hypothetical protein